MLHACPLFMPELSVFGKNMRRDLDTQDIGADCVKNRSF